MRSCRFKAAARRAAAFRTYRRAEFARRPRAALLCFARTVCFVRVSERLAYGTQVRRISDLLHAGLCFFGLQIELEDLLELGIGYEERIF